MIQYIFDGLVPKECPTLATPCTVTCQVPLSTGSSRQEYCLPFLSPGDLPNPGIKPGCPASEVDSLLTSYTLKFYCDFTRLSHNSSFSVPGSHPQFHVH